MSVDVTNLTLVRDTLKDRVLDAATADVGDLAEVFTITPTKGMDKIIIEVEVADTNGAVACKLGKGGQYWAEADLEWSCPQAKTTIMHVSDIARFMKHVAKEVADTMELTLTPASTKKLKTDHAAKVAVIELP